jgi:hypothetical protein
MSNPIRGIAVQYEGGAFGGSLGVENGLGRFIPEPRTSAAVSFKNFTANVGAAMSQAAGVATGIMPEYMALINAQLEAQRQMQLVSLYSKIEKSKHETQMAAVRNIRAG